MLRKLIHGWQPDLPDHRDWKYEPRLTRMPKAVDLRPECPAVVDQGQLGSCTGNSSANGFKFVLMKEGLPVFDPSRLFIYYNGRAIEGTTKQDAGAQIRDVVKGIATVGVCDEAEWAYNIAKFATKPSAKCFKDATANIATSYQRLDNSNLATLKGCLADGYPFVFGFTVYESFESDAVAKSGIVNMPQHDEKSLGGHAVLCIGYDTVTKRFLVMNSWGASWGQKGFFTIPFAYLTNTNLADDFWTLRIVK